MISSAPILKHQTFFLRELTHFQRIQPVPDDLSILAHTVSIYCTAYSKGDTAGNAVFRPVTLLKLGLAPEVEQGVRVRVLAPGLDGWNGGTTTAKLH